MVVFAEIVLSNFVMFPVQSGTDVSQSKHKIFMDYETSRCHSEGFIELHPKPVATVTDSVLLMLIWSCALMGFVVVCFCYF